MSHKPDPNKSVNLTIDGIPVTVPEGTMILEAAKKANVHIPVLCEHPDLCKRALCRICVVECDGRGKLIAACANDVWEGVSVVTNNKRLSKIRRTIIEMILANHPHDCLSCTRNKNCELQTLAAGYGAFKSHFTRDAAEQSPKAESETIVHDMSKCVKCSRCVEMCQEVQTIRAINTSCRSHEFKIGVPYNKSLKDSSCVFCGMCAEVCPVGAIYEYDQCTEVRTALNDNSIKTIAQVLPSLAASLNKEFAFAEGTITTGKMINAIKMLGFDKVYNAENAANASNIDISREAQARKTAQKTGAKNKPLISGCSEGAALFIKNFYPELKDCLTTEKNIRQQFASAFKNSYAKEAGTEPSKVMSVSFMACLAHKYTEAANKTDFALTVKELARMINVAGIMIETLPEEPFDTINIDPQKQETSVKKLTARGYAKAREIMEAILKGECDADWVEILSCPRDSNCSS